MQEALREIRQITSNTVTIPVPATFQNCSVEIIIFPLDNVPPQRIIQKKGWREQLIRATQIRTKIEARRNGQPLTSAVDMINQTREERNELFDNLC
jgi:hypothetical protein